VQGHYREDWSVTDPTTTRYVGLDVHKSSIVIAVADAGGAPATILATTPNDVASLAKALRRLGPAEALACCYETGPTGYGLYRRLQAAGFRCVVIAPSLVPVQSGNRVKTDRRDAAKLAHFLGFFAYPPEKVCIFHESDDQDGLVLRPSNPCPCRNFRRFCVVRLANPFPGSFCPAFAMSH
jgi:hypothetical protein